MFIQNSVSSPEVALAVLEKQLRALRGELEEVQDLLLYQKSEPKRERLRAHRVAVRHGVDATRRSATFGMIPFDNIIFQFPHTGSREAVEGRNPNFVLVRDFLKSTARQLSLGRKVLVSAVDNPHYRSAFQFEEVARLAGFRPPLSYRFYPHTFSGYTHTITHQHDSALGNHDSFAIWIFRLK